MAPPPRRLLPRSFGCWKTVTDRSGTIWTGCAVFTDRQIFRAAAHYILLPDSQTKVFLQNPSWQNTPPVLILQIVDNERRMFDLLRAMPSLRSYRTLDRHIGELPHTLCRLTGLVEPDKGNTLRWFARQTGHLNIIDKCVIDCLQFVRGLIGLSGPGLDSTVSSLGDRVNPPSDEFSAECANFLSAEITSA